MKDETRAPFTRMCLVGFFCLVTLLTVVGFSAKTWLPAVASQHGEGIDTVISYLLITTGMVFIVGHLALAWLIWKHTGDRPATYRPVTAKVEWLWALVPVLFMAVVSEAGVLFLGHPVWSQLYGDTPADAVRVEMVGKQFEWFVRYPGKSSDSKFGETRPDLVHEVRNPMGLVKKDPDAKDDIFVRGVLRLPVGRMASIRLRTHDVQHSFAVPAFRTKQDLVPGFPTHTQFVPTREGEYEIACAELCGLGHYKMRGTVIVMSQDEYDKWLASQYGWFE